MNGNGLISQHEAFTRCIDLATSSLVLGFIFGTGVTVFICAMIWARHVKKMEEK